MARTMTIQNCGASCFTQPVSNHNRFPGAGQKLGGLPVTSMNLSSNTQAAAKKEQGLSTAAKVGIAVGALAVMYGAAYGIRHSQGQDLNADIVKGLGFLATGAYDLCNTTTTYVGSFFTAKQEVKGDAEVKTPTEQPEVQADAEVKTPTDQPTVQPEVQADAEVKTPTEQPEVQADAEVKTPTVQPEVKPTVAE